MEAKPKPSYLQHPIMAAIVRAKDMIREADLGVFQRIITKEAGRLYSEDPEAYLGYVAAEIAKYQAERAAKAARKQGTINNA